MSTITLCNAVVCGVRYIAFERARSSGGDPPMITDDALPHFTPPVPKQKNSWDCGVFVLQYADEFVQSVNSGMFQVCRGTGFGRL